MKLRNISNLLKQESKSNDVELPINQKAYKNDFDFKRRFLDCAVIMRAHQLITDNKEDNFDSVRAAFWEGNELYSGAGFKGNNHIQLSIINPKCIKGIFLP